MQKKINPNNRYRMAVHKSNKYISAQIIDDKKKTTLAAVNFHETTSKSKSEQVVKAADIISEKAKKLGLIKLYLDRRDNRYQGRIKIFCELLRKNNLEI